MFQPLRGIYQVTIFSSLANNGVGGAETVNAFSPTLKYQVAESLLAYKPLRAGIRLRNTNPADSRQGGVVVLNSSSPISIGWDPAGQINTELLPGAFDSLWGAINGSPDSQFYTAEDLSYGKKEFICYPATAADYNSYGGQFNRGVAWQNVQDMWNAAQTDMPMSCLMFAFDQTDVSANSYNFEICTQSAQRHSENSILGGQMRSAGAVADQARVQALHQLVMQHGAAPYAGEHPPAPM